MNYLKRFETKKIVAMVLALTFAVVLVMSTVRTKAASGTVIDPIIYAMDTEANSNFDKYASLLIDQITSSFSPSFFIYRYLDAPIGDSVLSADYQSGLMGERSEMETGNTYLDLDENIYNENSIIGPIYKFATRFGVVLGTLITLGSLFLCMVGRAEQIRDTPLQVFIKYVVCMTLIYFSWKIMFFMISIVGDVWTNFVVTDSGTSYTMSYAAFANMCNVSGDSYAILGMPALNAPSVIAEFLFHCVKFFLIIKLIKQMLRLYVEIAERYFVSTMLLFFFPAICPTIISNSTSNIMHSYMRMFVSQAFLLLTNSIFMKIFVTLLLRGAWTQHFLGYICALAFVKFCTRIDGYMAAMGLNVAQTGGGMMDSLGGSLMALTSIMRMGSGISRAATNGATNAGKALMATGLQTNDIKSYNQGLNMTGQQAVSPTQFGQMVAKNLQSQPTSIPTYQGASFNTASAGGVNNLAKQINMSQQGMQQVLGQMGKTEGDVAKVVQLDGSATPSSKSGSHFQLFDADGNSLGVVDGVTGYANTTLSAELQSASYGSIPSYLSADEFHEITGVQGSPSSYRDVDTYDTVGHQSYLVHGDGTSDTYRYDVDLYASNPHMETGHGDGAWHSVKLENGSYAQWRRTAVKTTTSDQEP